MKITTNTKYFALVPILSRLQDEQLKELREKAPAAVLGRGGYLSLTIEQLAMLTTTGARGVFTKAEHDTEITVFEYYTLAGFQTFFDDYLQKLQRLTPQMTTEEKAAQAACMRVGMIEGLLLFARDYFGLHSFGDAEQVTLGDLLLAKKDVYNKAICQREYSRITQKKVSKK